MARSRIPAPILVLMGCSLFISPCRAQSRPAAIHATQAAPATNSTLSQVEIEAVGWLQGLLRINTTNPPGNELVAAKYIAAILQKEGIPSEIFESTPGRGFLVARLSSSAVPDPSRALLLMGHLDVVGVDKSKWTVDPLARYSRMAISMGAAQLTIKACSPPISRCSSPLKRSGARLNRDVIFLAEGDEEAGGDQRHEIRRG